MGLYTDNTGGFAPDIYRGLVGVLVVFRVNLVVRGARLVGDPVRHIGPEPARRGVELDGEGMRVRFIPDQIRNLRNVVDVVPADCLDRNVRGLTKSMVIAEVVSDIDDIVALHA